jgi:uncharacterized membrane protein/1-acyl-sn-glycerol-3-phosphate acyltransferase
MKAVKILFVCHLAALLFGLVGLLVMLPHPGLWSWNASLVEVFNFGIRYAGSLHILFGAATMLLFGLLLLGPRKTLLFFLAATTISLSMELLGTSTGFPFGAYAYTSFLGFKVLGLVPYSIPLSWFYMGFTSYLLASALVSRWCQRPHMASLHHGSPVRRQETLSSLILGAYFLTVWDLALDPAMASNALPLHFWVWQQTGPYFGMPLSNLLGWSLTGLAFMGVSRLLWRENLDLRRMVVWLPFGVYAVNIGFAIALDLHAGLWLPSLMAVILGVVPASLVVFVQADNQTRQTAGVTGALFKRIATLVVKKGSWILARRKVQLVVEGLEHVPRHGPVLIASRHFHHLYDGCVLLKAISRPLHIVVALDWVQQPWLRHVMEEACSLADWPIVLRTEQLQEQAVQHSETAAGAYALDEARSYLRHATEDSVRLLRQGKVLVVFPEAYPTIDPACAQRNDHDALRPFRPGFARLVELAERDHQTRVAIIPTGVSAVQKGRWQITLRFGPALSRDAYDDTAHLVQAVECQVRALSAEPLSATLPPPTKETIPL